MDEEDFLIALKSSIDKVMNSLRISLLPDYPTLRAVEVDDMAQTDAAQKSAEPVLVWALGSVEPAPRPPMYRVELLAGAKTTNDAGNYILTRLLSEVRRVFKAETSIQLFDSSGVTESADSVGYLHIASSAVVPQEFDRQSGLRFAVVRGNAVAYG